jgi:phosphotriesterase-related protein
MHEPWVAASTEAELASRLVADAADGMAGSGIRAGIYGEIGTSDPLTPGETKVLRAVAAAARETGLAISVHLHPWGHEGPGVLRALIDAGADPGRVVLGHVTTAIDRPDHLLGLAEAGAVLGFDLFGFDHSLLGPGRWPPSDRDAAAAVMALIHAGHRDSIVLGQDVGVRTRLRRWGGWGYGHLLEHVVPLLRELGAGQADLDAMLVRTPARLLAVAA